MVEIGSTIGNYEVLQKVGQGAMGAVYEARHPVIGKRVALKIIHPDLATNDEMVSRFFNEARAVTQIGHPNIVDVQDFGQTPSGESFIVMELLEGIGLGALIKKEKQLSIERAVKIATQLTDGLRAAHARGIIHRDLKPDNIFIVPRGTEPDFVKILDFGLAKLTGPGAMTHKTRTGAVLGTAHYMAPEAAEDSRSVDHRVDVYALGCILFQMIVGRVPFPGDGFGEVLVRQLREPPPVPSRLRADIPDWLEKIILHALAKKPDFRFANMEEFGAALRNPEEWTSEHDNPELSDDQYQATNVRVATPPPMEAVKTNPRSGPVSQLAADAKTMDAPMPAPMVPGPASWVQPGGTTELPNPPEGGQTTASPEHPDPSFVRRRRSSALGFGALVAGALALVSVGYGVTRHFLLAPVIVTLNTDPTGVEVILDGQLVATTPAQVKLQHGKKAVALTLQKAGYVTVRRAIEPRQDLTLDVSLLPEPKIAPTADPEPPPPDPELALAPPGHEDRPPPPPPTPVDAQRPKRDEPKKAPVHKIPRKPPPEAKKAMKKDGPLLLAPTF